MTRAPCALVLSIPGVSTDARADKRSRSSTHVLHHIMPKRNIVERDELDPTPFKVEDDRSSVSVKSEHEDEKPALEDTVERPVKRSRGRPGSKAWTSEDFDQLFTAMISGKTAKALEGKVDGRTGAQCLATWK